ncbi:hypothetical protein AVEN_136909-1 [Araneus ventricosus]|uniref:DUF4817 domain-containing protein n=1 Tax=Araneus ventricosus TaxID=182803 RepID=A0A4Y2BI42_ARAVE|nr:hypothetical protein AVEN_136909-1 [Araneus ventricosus]
MSNTAFLSVHRSSRPAVRAITARLRLKGIFVTEYKLKTTGPSVIPIKNVIEKFERTVSVDVSTLKRFLQNFALRLRHIFLTAIPMWQTLWKNGDTGRKIYDIMPSVSLRPINWFREDVIFFSQHGPFPAYLKRFHLSDSEYCSCGGIGTALHYATECIFTVSWHMRKPMPNSNKKG